MSFFLYFSPPITLTVNAQTSETQDSAIRESLVEREEDLALDERLQRLYRRVRCPVCAGQPISESEAPLSRILREELAKKIAAGESEEEALAWLVARYGEGVLLRPRFGSAALLWLAPILLGFGALLALRARTRRAK